MNRALLSKASIINKAWIKTTIRSSSFDTSKKIVFHNHPTTSLSYFNNKLSTLIRAHRMSGETMLERAREITDKMDSQELQYDLNTFNALLSVHARNTDKIMVGKILKTMQEKNIVPTTDSYNFIIEAYANQKDILGQLDLKREMEEKGLELNTITYYHMLRAQQKDLKMALETLEDMKKKGLSPNLMCYLTLIRACNERSADVAFRLLKEAEESGLSVKSEPRMYFDVLRLGSRTDSNDLVTYCWNKAISEHSLRADEGTCLQVLRVAAKNGDTRLATDVIRQLSTNGYPYKEHYFTPLMEAFLANDDLKNAFSVLDIMRVSGVPPSMTAVYAFREKLSKDVEVIDKAYYILEELKKEGKQIDIVAFNVVVASCADAGDVERTVSTYREAAKLGVVPDVDTYNSILNVCIKAQVNKMDEVVISEMKKAEISPNVDTYMNMIELSCDRENFEEAFNYLEAMKEYGILPPLRCYSLLAEKLAWVKDPRFHLVLEEMESFGYKIGHSIRSLWRNDVNI